MNRRTELILRCILNHTNILRIHLRARENIDEALKFCEEGYLVCEDIKSDSQNLYKNGAYFKVTKKGMDSLDIFRTMLEL